MIAAQVVITPSLGYGYMKLGKPRYFILVVTRLPFRVTGDGRKFR